MFDFSENYNKENFEKFLDYILPYEKLSDTIKINNNQLLKSITKIGQIKFEESIPVFEVEHLSKNDPRVELTNNLFNILNKFSISKALVIFYCEDSRKYRFSLIESSLIWTSEINVKRKFSHPKRLSFLLGEGTKIHTPYNQFKKKIVNYEDLKKRFDKEVVTEEFFENYKRLFFELLEKFKKDKIFLSFLEKINLDINLFVKKLMGQIIFCYFLEKKGWLGANKDQKLENGDINFFRNNFDKCEKENKNFYNDFLEYLFYEGLNKKNPDNFCKFLNFKIPYLNGGLFENLKNYDWKKENIKIDNEIFSNNKKNGILDIFDLYNFTVDESSDLDVEIAIDPEMLGKVFEALISENLKKKKGIYYTDRTVVTHMCRETIVSFLYFKFNKKIKQRDLFALFFIANESRYLSHDNLPPSIKKYCKTIDYFLKKIKICDPAVGSGAFPVVMLSEICKARSLLQSKSIKKNKMITLKKNFIENSLFAVDIDISSIEIAKLRLWLSLIVEEKNYNDEIILPNLDFKIIEANSLKTYPIDIFSVAKFREISSSCRKYFKETDSKQKEKLKEHINKFISDMKNNDQFDFRLLFFELFYETDESKKGFDIVIANPPYIGEKENKDTLAEIKKGELNKYYQGKMDYFYFFFHQGLNLLKSNGMLCFITTNYFITASGARNLRNDFFERSSILKLINFKEYKIFKTAKGQHNLITLLKKGKDDDQDTEITNCNLKGNASRIELEDLFKKKSDNCVYLTVKNIDLYDGEEKYLRLSGHKNSNNLERKVLEKIKSNNYSLEIYADVKQGVVSGADKLTDKHLESFNIKGNKGDGIFVLNDHEIDMLKLNKEEKKIIKKFYKNSEIDKFKVNINSSNNIIYITKNTIAKEYPNILNHLKKFKQILEQKREAKEGKIPWYSLHWPRDEKLLSRRKIVCPRRSKYNNFALEEGKYYEQSDIMIISIKNKFLNILSFEELLAYLNSKVVYFWLTHKGKIKGDSLELYGKPLEELPIPIIKDEKKKNTINKVTLNLIKNFNEKEFSKLNYFFYEFYNFSNDEINLIENSYSF